MKQIPFTQNEVALVDDEDYARCAQYSWYVNRSHGVSYAARREGPAKARKTVMMHRFIQGAEPGQMVDHADGDGLNNTRANLRFADAAQSAANRGRRRDSSSPYRGVTFSNGRWWAMLMVRGRRRYLGIFADAESAARAYDAAAVEAWGEFARLNFPGHRSDTMTRRYTASAREHDAAAKMPQFSPV